MTSWHSYPKVHSLGHAAISELLFDDVIVQEKIDGSQFSFGKFDGALKCRSKSVEIDHDAMGPNNMFSKAVETVRELMPLLTEGYTYRCEYLRIPKHNIHAYSRVPAKHLILFDINCAHEGYLAHDPLCAEAEKLGLELVPCFFQGKITNIEQFYELLDRESILGGQKVEGVVIKNYHRFGVDKKVLMGKYVSEAFKEKHKVGWKEMNPQAKDVIEILKAKYRSEARWQKAVQHLRESGELTDTPKDIGALMREVCVDTHTECKAEIMDDLFKWAWPKLQRAVYGGLPEWYKAELAKKQFQVTLEPSDGEVNQMIENKEELVSPT